MNGIAAAPRLELLPPPVRERLEQVAELGRRRGVAVYLVGGLVRDTLLGRDSLDVDLVVEGDGPAFAQALAAEIAAPLRVHRVFQTAQIADPVLGPLDIATARRESYSAPAALPQVVPASIEEDLGRRDFAVNALALRLDRESFLDPWDGLTDLAARRLRALHQGSFVDDPTRILRGVRLGARLGFQFDETTAELAHAGIAAGVFAPLSGARLTAELELLAGTDPESLRIALERLAGLGFFEAVLGVARPTAFSPTAPVGDRLLSLLLALARGRDEVGLADRLQLVGERRQRFVGAGERAERARTVLARDGVKPHEVHEALAALGDEELALLAAEPPPVGAWARLETDRLRPLSLGVQGRHLLAQGMLPGPRVGEVLAEVRRARLDGEIEREGELELAMRLVERGNAG